MIRSILKRFSRAGRIERLRQQAQQADDDRALGVMASLSRGSVTIAQEDVITRDDINNFWKDRHP